MNTIQETEAIIREVFATDSDLYLRRQHSDNKTLDGLVDFTIQALYDGSELANVDVYTYGDRYGFFAVNSDGLLRSFGIKKEHRDKKDLFWEGVKEVLGDEFIACIWSDNRNARRFFEQAGGNILVEDSEIIAYIFKN